MHLFSGHGNISIYYMCVFLLKLSRFVSWNCQGSSLPRISSISSKGLDGSVFTGLLKASTTGKNASLMVLAGNEVMEQAAENSWILVYSIAVTTRNPQKIGTATWMIFFLESFILHPSLSITSNSWLPQSHMSTRLIVRFLCNGQHFSWARTILTPTDPSWILALKIPF